MQRTVSSVCLSCSVYFVSSV